MKARLSVVSEYSEGRTFEDAVANLFQNGLMNGSYKLFEGVDSREQARRGFRSWYNPVIGEAEVKYIVVETYNEKYDEWEVDYSEGIEVLPCQ